MNCCFLYTLTSTCINTVSLFVRNKADDEIILYMGINDSTKNALSCSFEILEYKSLKNLENLKCYKFISCHYRDIFTNFEGFKSIEQSVLNDAKKNFFESKIFLKTTLNVKLGYTYNLMKYENRSYYNSYSCQLILNHTDEFFSVKLSDLSLLTNNTNGMKQIEKDINFKKLTMNQNELDFEHQEEKGRLTSDCTNIIQDPVNNINETSGLNITNTTGVKNFRDNEKTTEEAFPNYKPIYKLPTIYTRNNNWNEHYIKLENNSHIYDIKKNYNLPITDEQTYNLRSVHRRSIITDQISEFPKNNSQIYDVLEKNLQTNTNEQISVFSKNNIQSILSEQIYDVPKNNSPINLTPQNSKQTIYDKQIYDLTENKPLTLDNIQGHDITSLNILSLNNEQAYDIPEVHKNPIYKEKSIDAIKNNRESYEIVEYANVYYNKQIYNQSNYSISTINRQTDNNEIIYGEIIFDKQIYDKVEHKKKTNNETIYSTIIFSTESNERMNEERKKKLYEDSLLNTCTSVVNEGYFVANSIFESLKNSENKNERAFNLKDKIYNDVKCGEEERIHKNIKVSEAKQKKSDIFEKVATRIKTILSSKNKSK
ncbi:uncharacterized protein VNE69_09134 [Vairimorpha necatrix]|uniref:Uncharacterized protein n=1 Tax=Vairimorpha necatrix TaxID=6039 RepID=A0AAX4JFI8_9MICR